MNIVYAILSLLQSMDESEARQFLQKLADEARLKTSDHDQVKQNEATNGN